MVKVSLSSCRRQRAAGLAGVLSPYLVSLLESGAYCISENRHASASAVEHLMTYKKMVDAKRLDALNELMRQAQELGLGLLIVAFTALYDACYRRNRSHGNRSRSGINLPLHAPFELLAAVRHLARENRSRLHRLARQRRLLPMPEAKRDTSLYWQLPPR